MHENKFEKQVQDKMEELQFVPSDAVWENVDKEINKDKNRRRPVFWLFLFFGLMLLGGGYFFSLNNKTKTQVSKIQEDKVHGNKVQESKEQEYKKQESKVQGDKAQVDMMQEKKKQESKEQEDKVQVNKEQESRKQEKIQGNYSDQYSQNNKNNFRDEKIKGSSATKSSEEKLKVEGTADIEKNKNKSLHKSSAEKEISNEVADNDKESTNKIEQSADKKIIADSSAITKANIVADNKSVKQDSAVDKKVAANKKQQNKSSAWKIGFTGGAGISNVNESLFKSTYVTNPSAYIANNNTAGPTSPSYISSEIKPDFSFDAGVFVNKNLSKRVSFSAGISYHYYSTKIHTGNSIDSSIYVYSNVPSAFQANGYYRTGNDKEYINQYHFIELPLSLNFQLNKNQKVPLIWEADASLSYLINSNALHFDPATGVYYKNNELFDKTQINAATAIMIGFHLHKSELLIGPQLQYGLTRLLNKNTGNPEHLFYSGLKISFIPQKK